MISVLWVFISFTPKINSVNVLWTTLWHYYPSWWTRDKVFLPLMFTHTYMNAYISELLPVPVIFRNVCIWKCKRTNKPSSEKESFRKKRLKAIFAEHSLFLLRLMGKKRRIETKWRPPYHPSTSIIAMNKRINMKNHSIWRKIMLESRVFNLIVLFESKYIRLILMFIDFWV